MLESIYDIMLEFDPIDIIDKEDYYYIYRENAVQLSHYILANFEDIDIQALMDLSEFNLYNLCQGVIDVEYNETKHHEMIIEILYYI